jgi:hypothetical protein
MSSMDKMWASLIAIGLMALASALITFARVKTKGFVRIVLSVLSVLLLIIMVPFAFVSML